MDITVYQEEKHSLCGGLLVKWRTGRHQHLPLTGTPMMMMMKITVVAFFFPTMIVFISKLFI